MFAGLHMDFFFWGGGGVTFYSILGVKGLKAWVFYWGRIKLHNCNNPFIMFVMKTGRSIAYFVK